MKKTLLSLLTTVAFAAPAFAADELTTGTTQEAPTSEFAVKTLSQAVEAELSAFQTKLGDIPYISQNITLIRQLLTRSATDLSLRTNELDRPPIILAARHSLFNTVAALANLGIPLTYSCVDSDDALTTAVGTFTLDEFKQLFNIPQEQNSKVTINYTNSSGTSLLFWAILWNSETATWLLDQNALVAIPDLVQALINNRSAELIERLKAGLTPEEIAEAENAVTMTQQMFPKEFAHKERTTAE